MLELLIISSSKHYLDRLVGLREAEGTGDLGWSKLRWSRGLVGAHGKVGNFCFVVCGQRDIKRVVFFTHADRPSRTSGRGDFA